MRTDLIRDLFLHLDADGSLQVGPCPSDANKTLEDLSIPMGLKRVLQWYWTNRGGELGGYTLYSLQDSLANEDYPTLILSNMFPIGCATNGDPLVLCFDEKKCAVGLVSHDQFWEERADPKTAYAEVTGSIEEFLWRAAEGRYLPVDYYAASELQDMRREIAGNGAA